jgi:hypothetical protein
MHSPDDYRRAAADTRRLAARTSDEWERKALERMAAQWERLAEYKAKKETDKGRENSN